jgi:DNA mismatch endonuclease (patch repair protein)
MPSRVEASSEDARVRMERTRRRDTAPELALRSSLHRRGLRFRVDKPVLAGSRRRADIVFPRPQVAVFVDGCFWHGCPEHGTMPKANRRFWEEKLAANRSRDRSTDEQLVEAGWKVMRFWEHVDPQAAAAEIAAELSRRSPASNR